MSTYKVKATKTTTGMQVAAGTRGFEITFDEPGSTNTGMNPVEILLASFGACQAITATELARKRGFDLRAFWVEVEGDLNREDVATGDNRYKFTEIRYQPHVRSDESDEDIKKFLADVARKCPVENTLAFGTKFVPDGFVKE
ncbi:MAG: OsmC family protein [Limosilactobacillus pontis]|uniref:Peroxiredoxin n=1 Tax=Limosilactobacillus pontis TaxID=35787 RepID=A0A2J6NNW5_9LACO|nr:OsmC family protein [Limosilactobacillus pontis]PMB83012.1 peroxiredoxin [Limosilactobacillus pontis]